MLRLFNRDEGVGIVTALMVAFIIFSLGAMWFSLSTHELDETLVDRHRTSAVQVADAGVRHAMYELAQTEIKSLPFWTGTGTTGTDCNLETIVTSVEGVDDQLGEYYVQVTDSTPLDLDDGRYFIETWAWAPDTDARQALVRKIEQEVDIVVRRGFVYALFASSGGLAAGNRKVIHGDIYSGPDAVFDNSTDILDNGSWPGDGNLRVAGSLTINSGSNVLVQGDVHTNGFIDDQNSGDDFNGDVMSTYSDGYFSNANIGGTVRLGGVLLPGSDVNGAPVVQGDTGLAEVPLDPLPEYSWTDAKALYTDWHEYATWADFDAYFQANKTSLTGEHYVQEIGDFDWNIRNAEFDGDFVLVVEGSVVVRSPAGVDPAAAPVWVTVVGNSPLSGATPSVVTLGKNFKSTEDLRWLVYSKGSFASISLTTIYGVVYGEEDASTNNLEVFYRPPQSELGFKFTTLPQVDVEPLVWREVPAGTLPCDLP